MGGVTILNQVEVVTKTVFSWESSLRYKYSSV